MRIEEKASYPRPDFIRKNYISLCGEWDFDFDDAGSVRKAFASGCAPVLSQKLRVPFPFQSPAGGIGSTEKHERVCYRRTFGYNSTAPEALLHFGAVDRIAEVWLNGAFLGSHCGGYTPFCFEVGGIIKQGENELVVYVTDEDTRGTVRGKQIWEGEPRGCHYIPVTGIWQEVWLEPVPAAYIRSIRYETDFDRHRVFANVEFNRPVSGELKLSVSKGEAGIAVISRTVSGKRAGVTIDFEDHGTDDKAVFLWTPKTPNLFDVDAALSVNGETDLTHTYFGIRKTAVQNGRYMFNNSQLYLRMVLDQGYWEEGIYRPLDDDGFRKDVEMTLRLGFNAARKHQKIEDPKYYYWADRLGLLVWGELPSFYSFCEEACADAEKTMREFIERDANHPCITAWVPFNESWGLRNLLGDKRQADFAREIYYLCKRLDPSRPVSTNDGWENITPTDIYGIHDYRIFDAPLAAYYSRGGFFDSGAGRTGHPFLMPGEAFSGGSVMLTEFGGIREGGEFEKEIAECVKNVASVPTFCGFCYTQLTDVYQEQNGLLFMNRTPKADPDTLFSVFSENGKRY